MKFKPLFILIYVLTSFILENLKAQTPNNYQQEKYTVTGSVVDENGTPLEFATVRVFAASDDALATGNVTDAKGNFKINVSEGTYYVVVSFISYQSKTFSDISINANNPSTNLGQVQLSTDSKTLNEIEVVAEKSTMELQLDKRVFNVGQDLANLGGSATQILDNIPSVSVDVEGNVSLRGSQSVRILINGRPSGLTGMGSSEALRLLQGNLIERVEVITNPSARYEAEGQTGIINIVLKKEQKGGLNGSFDLNAGYPENFGAAFNLNYRAKWINLFASYGVNYRDTPGSGFSNQRFFDENGNTISSFLTKQDRSRADFGNTLRTGADIFLGEKNTLTIAGLYRFSKGNNITNIRYDDFDKSDNFVQTVLRDQDERETDNNIEIELNHKIEFGRPGNEWVSNFKWINSDDTENADLFENNLNNSANSVNQRSFNTENEENIIFQSDYVQPFAKDAKFEAGVRVGLRTIENDFLVEQQNEDGDFEALAEFDNAFNYQERVYAAYGIIGNKWGKFSVQGGLRVEITDIEAALKDSDQNSNQNYMNLFPSAFFAYELDQANTFQLSYSRRLSRPWFRLLLPFSNFSDSRNFRAGNPNLTPEFTHSIEAGYLHNWKSGNVLSSVYYRRTTGVIERITLLAEDVDFIDITGVANGQVQNITLPVNLSAQDAYGIEFTVSKDITNWWTLNGNVNFYKAMTEGSFNGQIYTSNVTSLSARAASKIELPAKMALQTNVRYRGPENNTQGLTKSITMIDLALAKDIFKGNGTLTLNVSDLLNNRKRRSETRGANFFTESEFQWRARQFMLNFTYRLNQKKERKGEGRGGDFDGDF
jgi:outer membrane receptor protein involved in Fe transport